MKRTIFLIFLLTAFSVVLRSQGDGGVKPEEPIEINFSAEGGFYMDEVEVEITAPGSSVYYTLDGRRPTTRSKFYSKPIVITKTSVLRVLAYRHKSKKREVGQTYFIDEPPTGFPVVSIGITPYVLFDPENGMFMKGTHAVDSLWTKPGANFWSRKEVRVHVDIFESDGSNVYNNLTGLRLFGGMSRLFPQKSLALVARNRYGENRIKHPVFGKGEPKKYKFLVLRNSGSDFRKSHFRDGLMTGLVEDWDIETQAYRPSHVYINGKYWGIYNIREKVNRYFLQSHSEADKDSIDLMEHRYISKRGDKEHYGELLSFVKENDLSIPQNYYWIQSQMEVTNFIDYQIAQIYFDNQDAGGNIKYWRPRTDQGRWRWILYDTDWGFGLHDDDAYRNNSLKFHTKPNGPRWPNPPWSTLFLRKLLENPDFERTFVNRFADHLNESFASEKVGRKIDDMYQVLLPEMPRHIDRWNLDFEKWQHQVRIMRTFAAERPFHLRMQLMDYFSTGSMRDVTVEASTGGTVYINNNLEVRQKPLQGKYFEKYPITVRAVADYGYRFVGWEGVEVDEEVRGFELELEKETYEIKAVFEKYTHPLAGKLMINEVCPYSKKTGDWIELHNQTEEIINMEGWVLTDRKNEFVLPDVEIAPNDYLVVCRDSTKFFRVFPTAYNVVSGLNFGLNKRQETLGLFSRRGAVVDSFHYSVPPTDSAFTLSLLLPTLDNGDFENWESGFGQGTPNAPNPFYVESRIKKIQTQWMQIGLAAAVVLICVLLLFLRAKEIL
ncbi:MAG: hypothetical protein DWQ02_14015 [Bacteroidetes bacterium]|nr:MAG: hypothetical protein DWQ02_14015 [Bacteroidota bacterium]